MIAVLCLAKNARTSSWCLAQSVHTTLWQKFIMHHAIAIEGNSEQSLHIWPTLKYLFQSWLSWTFPLGWLGFGFNVIMMLIRDSSLVLIFYSKTVARIHSAPRHCHRRKQWAKPLHLTKFDVFFSVLALLNISIGMIGLLFQSYSGADSWFVISFDLF